MRLRALLAAVLAAVSLGAASAEAQEAFATANVNMRAGPDIDFPSIMVIPEGDEVYVEGCLRDESWCDVRWEDERGWVYSEYLAFDYRGEMVPLPDMGLAAFRVPVVVFSFGSYWDRYYVGRPWYRDRARWYSFRPRPRVGWRGPPQGPRRPGWWRSGYRAPSGMRPPPDRGWRRPARAFQRDRDRGDRGRYERRDDRDRGDRRGGDRDRDRDRGDRRGDRDGRDGGRGSSPGATGSGPPTGGSPGGRPPMVRPY